MPLAADAHHIWISDYDRVGAYDTDTGRWTTTSLPYDREELAGMRISSLDGGGVIVALHCEGRCGQEEVDPTAHVVAFRVSAPAHLEPVTISGPGAEAVPASSLTLRYAPKAGTVRFAVNTGTSVVLLDVPASGPASSSRVDGDFALLCPVQGDGFVAVEHARSGDAGAVSFQLPKGSSAQAARATASMAPPEPLRVVGGTAASLAPLDVPAIASDVLADQLWLSEACLDDGLALIGKSSAAELVGGAWRSVPARVSRAPMGSSAGQVDRLPDGTLLAATGAGTVVRDSTGTWITDTDPFTVRIAMGDEVLRYAQPSNPPTSSDPGAPQRKTP